MTNIPNHLIEKITNDIAVRREITKDSHRYFMAIYLHEYIKYPSASFHSEMIEFTERTDEKLFAVVSFRGSAKSTIFSLSYPIWAILGKQQKKFVLIISRTQVQARQLLHNIKVELERNDLLKQDLGPFEEPQDEWRAASIVIPKYDARIMVLSADQSMRGLRHKSHRPDLIICDDIEDIASTKTQDNRDKTFNWFTGEIIPAGDLHTKIILIGNLVHDDSLMVRLREKIENNEVSGVFKAYPLINSHGECLWPEKFPDEASLEVLRKEVMSKQAWEREYLLKIIPDDEQIIDPLWIRTYHEIPADMKRLGVFVGVDLAISEKTTADYTAMVPVLACSRNSELYLYVLPEIVHARMSFPKTCEQIQYLDLKLNSKYKMNPEFIIENVAYQDAVVQHFDKTSIDVEGVRPLGDKRVFFPHEASDKLIQELIHFGSEKHDDLADAFSLVTLEVMVNKKPERPVVFFA